jgi:uncharacterized protein YjlB
MVLLMRFSRLRGVPRKGYPTDMFIIPLSGVVQFLGASGVPVEVSPGNVLVVPRGNWHEISNVSSVDSQVLHFFSGVGAVEDIGYEAYKGQGEATPSLGRRQGSSA